MSRGGPRWVLQPGLGACWGWSWGRVGLATAVIWHERLLG